MTSSTVTSTSTTETTVTSTTSTATSITTSTETTTTQFANDIFNILELSQAGSQGVAYADGAVHFEGSLLGSLGLIGRPYGLGNSFSLSSVFRQRPGTGGYLFARTNVRGTVRYFAVYLHESNPGITLYYVPSGATETSLHRFNLDFPLNDGAWHSIGISFADTAVSLYVDSVLVRTATLVGPVADCNSTPDCVTFVGMRSSIDDNSFPFTGAMRSLVLRLRTATPLPPPLSTIPAPMPVGILSLSQIDILNGPSGGFAVPPGLPIPTSPLVLNGTFAYISTAPHSNTASFTVAVRLRQASGDGGYVFAQSRVSIGSVSPTRIYGLYSSPTFMTFYYRPSNSDFVSKVRFPSVVSDGNVHTVILSVNALSAELTVDGVSFGALALTNPVEACSDCHLVIGGRHGDNGTTVHRLIGTVSDVVIYSHSGSDLLPPMPRDPFESIATPVHTSLVDLAGNQHISLLEATQLLLKGGALLTSSDTAYNTVVFDGSSGGLLLTQPLLTLPYSYVINVALDTGSAGFIFAKTDASATRRYSALYYSRVSREVRYFYTFQGQTERVTFSNVVLDDGTSHTILLSITSGPPLAQAHLRLDGSSTAFIQSLRGVPEDCGATSPTCVTYVGQRADDVNLESGGRFGITGTLNRLLFYPSFLIADPSIAEGIERFTKSERRYLAGLNDGGEFTSGVPLAACVSRCIADPLCRSFDAGRSGTAFDGACFISHTTQVNGTLRISDVYDYYELSTVF